MKLQIETQLEIEMQLFRMKDSQSASKSEQGSIGKELKTQIQIWEKYSQDRKYLTQPNPDEMCKSFTAQQFAKISVSV